MGPKKRRMTPNQTLIDMLSEMKKPDLCEELEEGLYTVQLNLVIRWL